MYVLSASTSFVTALMASHANAYIRPPLSGHDFDFSAVYTSGLKLSTSSPPTDILPVEEIALKRPVVTLSDPDSAGRDDRYISFLEISYLPTIDTLDDVIYAFPWIKTNQIVLENGTLSDELYESSQIYHADAIESGEVRNATLHVWRQTPSLMDYIDDDVWPTLWQLAGVWSNTTSKVDYDFARANVDFKVRNDTGTFRGDVDENGATISGYVSTTSMTTATSATAGPTDVPATTTGSGSVPASSTTAAGPTETPNAASPLVFSASWAIGVLGIVLFVLAGSAI
ncbi:hypothetical protein F4677DRAFT_119356 [Hypoxylon crocopeplum]|nr:hypothetical protein F4677DRAFT_119356 [Hypoxylon crocopeplum]